MPDKKFTQEQVDKLIEKEIAKSEKAAVAATKQEQKRVLDLLKAAGVDNKEVESKEVKTHVANLLKELTAAVKEAA